MVKASAAKADLSTSHMICHEILFGMMREREKGRKMRFRAHTKSITILYTYRHWVFTIHLPLLVNRAFSIITSRKLVFLFRFFEMCAWRDGLWVKTSKCVCMSFFSQLVSMWQKRAKSTKNQKTKKKHTQRNVERTIGVWKRASASINESAAINKQSECITAENPCNKPISIFSSFCILNLLPFARGFLSPSIPFYRIGYTSNVLRLTHSHTPKP